MNFFLIGMVQTGWAGQDGFIMRINVAKRAKFQQFMNTSDFLRKNETEFLFYPPK